MERETTIKSLRLLCKQFVGRTSATPMATINKYMRGHSEQYVLGISAVKKRTPTGGAVVTLEARKDGRQENGNEWPRRQKSITLPCALSVIVQTILGMDAQAEVDYGLVYGGQRAQRAQ